MTSLTTLFSSKGAFAEYFSGYSPRAEQLSMAKAVDTAINLSEIALIEAGTGVGKTFAYLVPALLSGQKVIISTGTKALQEQLYERDLKTVCTILNLAIKTALLKGRGNYLCPYRLNQNLISFKGRPEQRQQLLAIKAWGDESVTGDLSGTTLLDERSPLWSVVTSTADNCLGQECPDWDQCFLVKARRKAQKADVVVVNHHLLFADFVLREDGFGEVLPDADVFVLDEAHQLPEVGSQFLGKVLSTRQLVEFCKDVRTEMRESSDDMPDLTTALMRLEQRTSQVETTAGEQPRTGAWIELEKKEGFLAALNTLAQEITDVQNYLSKIAERSKGLERCFVRCEDLNGKLKTILQSETSKEVKWFERRIRALLLKTTPLDIGENFQAFLAAKKSAWVLTSATMTVANSFSYFNQRLGLEAATTYTLGSPFDYQKQSVLYLPEGLPEPKNPDYTRQMIEKSIQVIELSEGRAFVLFTSFKALREAESILENRLGYPLLVQGREDKTTLLKKFRELGNAVLLGTMSFWEGVDVKGPALSCVIIDKLPFAPPNDPVMSARMEAMRQQGRNPFMEYQLPNAAIILKQGLGRLIRDASDRGVLMICDPRLRTARYGKTFLNSLPKMTITQSIDDLSAFL